LTFHQGSGVSKFAGMNLKATWTFGIFLLLLFGACKPDPITGDGPLEFSEDTVSFDSIFTGYASPSERLIFTNTGNRKIKIDAIYLEAGDQSEFDMIVDGKDSNLVKHYELAAGDSAVIFIKMQSNELDDFVRDRIIFESGGKQQAVVIETWVLDANFISAPPDSVLVLSCNTVLFPGKPYVLDGIIRVAEGCTLRIEAGTVIHFTPRKDENFNLISMIEVLGTLQIAGTLGNEVILQQSRLDGVYEENPGQWRGIRLWTTSRDNTIRHAIIKNGLIGIEVDSVTVNASPKLLIEQSEIRNMAGYGLLAIGASGFPAGTPPIIRADNCLLHNCAFNTMLVYAGGNCEFNNCTFANYTLDFTRKDPQIGFSNYFEDTAGTVFPFEVDVKFRNCIIWGSEEEEVGYDTVTLASFPVKTTFDRCVVRSTFLLSGAGLIFNQDPAFIDPFHEYPQHRNYRPGSSSPAINSGEDLSNLFYDDLDGMLRSQPFDIGAFEFFQE